MKPSCGIQPRAEWMPEVGIRRVARSSLLTSSFLFLGVLFLPFKTNFSVCVSVCVSACTHVCRGEKTVLDPDGAGRGCWELNSCPLQEQRLPAEPLFQPFLPCLSNYFYSMSNSKAFFMSSWWLLGFLSNLYCVSS